MKDTINRKQELIDAIANLLKDEHLDSSFFMDLQHRVINGKNPNNKTLSNFISDQDCRKLSTLMDHMPGMAYRCKNDKMWTMLFVSSGCFGLTGYHQAEIINNAVISYADIVHPKDRNIVFNAVNDAVTKLLPFDIEYRIKDKNGNTKWVWERGRLIKNGYNGQAITEGFITEITNWKKTEEKLTKNENQLKKAQAIGKTGSWEIDLKNKKVYASEESVRIYGFNKKKYYSLLEIQGVVLKEYREVLDKALSGLINGQNYNVEFKIKRQSDGAVVDINSIAEYNREENRVTGIIQDITERKRAENLLKENEAMYRSLIENSNDAIYILFNRKFEVVNSGFKKMLGYSAEDIKKSNFDPFYFIADESLPLIRERIAKLEKGEKVSNRYEFTAVAKSGEKKQVEASVSYIPYKGGTAVQGILRDVTERKRNEQKIKSLSGLKSLLVELSANFIHVPVHEIEQSVKKSLARLGEFVGVDRAYVFEYNFKESYCRNTFEWCSIGTSPQIDNLQHVPFDLTLDWIEKHQRGEAVNIPDIETITDLELKKILKEQDIKSLLTLPLHSNEKCIGFVGFDAVKDYLHFTGDEIDILQVYAKILVNSFERQQRERELIIAKEHAEESDLLKSAFLANVSHEIRTPMNGIIGFTTLLKEPKLSGEELEEYIDIIQQSGERMLNTIDDIISISKLESGTIEVKLSDYDIEKQLNYFYRFFKPETDKNGLQLIIDKNGESESIKIKTDKDKLNAVLSNLIKNAIKYTRTGHIKVGYKTLENEVEFYVEDTGIGIKKELLESVFERFVQEDFSSTKPYEGVGLGLSISKGYVEMIGGRIIAESEKGKGSRFSFTIPV